MASVATKILYVSVCIFSSSPASKLALMIFLFFVEASFEVYANTGKLLSFSFLPKYSIVSANCEKTMIFRFGSDASCFLRIPTKACSLGSFSIGTLFHFSLRSSSIAISDFNIVKNSSLRYSIGISNMPLDFSCSISFSTVSFQISSIWSLLD